MYIHCRKCVLYQGKAARLELELTSVGLDVRCRDHGRVLLLTPQALAHLMLEQPRCEHCENGVPHKHEPS